MCCEMRKVVSKQKTLSEENLHDSDSLTPLAPI